MEYINVSKSILKVIKQLLNFSSKDSYREELFLTVKVDIEKGTIGSADGFKLVYVKMTDELKEVFKESGVFKVQTGTINYKPVITLEKYEGKYPNLEEVMPHGDVFVKFGISPHLLREALKYANGDEPVQFIIYDYKNMTPTQGITMPIEMRFSVGECSSDAVIMPMHMSSDGKRWGVKE